MRRLLALLVMIPLIGAGTVSNRQAVRIILDKMIAGEALPPEILDRQIGYPQFPNLDQAIASARGCKVQAMDSLTTGNYGVQWRCKGRKRNEQPSAMIIYVQNGQVTRITTAVMGA